MKNKDMLINDKSAELTSLYNNIKYKNKSFVSNLQSLQVAWVGLEKVLDNNIEFFNVVYSKYKLNKIDKDKLNTNIEHFINDIRID